MKTVEYPFVPRKWQQLIPYELKRFNVLVLHRGAGKTEFCAHHTVVNATTTPGNYGYITPELKQGKRVFWRTLKRYASLVPGTVFNETDLTCTFSNGSVVHVLGADNSTNLRGTHWHGLIFDETQDHDKGTWDTVRPATETYKAWVIFIGTPKGHNFFYRLYLMATNPYYKTDWYGVKLDALRTGVFDHDAVEQSRQECIQLNGDDSMFRQEYMCDFESAISGGYYTRALQDAQNRGAFTRVPFDPSHLVHTAWDIGGGQYDPTAIWFFQKIGYEYRFIDYIEDNMYLDDAIRRVKAKPYAYGVHLGPHDLGVHSATDGITRAETARTLGIDFFVVPKLSVEEGINAVRQIIPLCVFDDEKCRDKVKDNAVGIESLFQYSPKIDKAGNAAGPNHDCYSHGADAFRYFAVGHKEIEYAIAPKFDWRANANVKPSWNVYDSLYE